VGPTRIVRNRQDRSFQVFVGAGDQEEAQAKRDFLDGQRWRADDEHLLVATVRRPLPSRGARWSVVLGLRDPQTDRVRVFFSEPEARRLLDSLRRRVPGERLGPLARREFAVERLRSLL
jgi:hypothetical protein